MKKYFILFFTITLNLSAQNVNKETQFVNEIINYFVDRDSTLIIKDIQIVDGFNSQIQASPEWYIHKDIFSKVEPFFKLSDSTYYFEQINKHKNVKLILTQNREDYKFIDRKKIDDFVLKSEEDYEKGVKYDFYEEFDKQIGTIQEFGLPIMSKNKKYLLLRKITSGPGKKASATLKLYKRKGKDWIYVKTIMDMVK